MEKCSSRLIVCVDGADFQEDGTLGHDNVSSIFKIKSLAQSGECYDRNNRPINQTVRYYQAASDGRFGKLKGRSSGSIDQQIKDITRDICQRIQAGDELWFYGYSRGAYVVRAVASLVHLGVPKDIGTFDDFYSKALEVQSARSRDDSLNGTRLLSQLQELCDSAPMIAFMGLFDTIKPSSERQQYDISFVNSIEIVRHALAFNETGIIPETYETPQVDLLGGRSLIEAWFIGSHHDHGGGAAHDGLGLYSFQWIVLESLLAGLVVKADEKERIVELAFPQFKGQVPNLGGDEKVEWRLPYTNGTIITMFDLQSLHTDAKSNSEHSIHLDSSSRIFKAQRKIWNNTSKALLGWNPNAPIGTILHPSVYVILDRNPKLYDSGLFKIRKRELADFQERCFDNRHELQPWLEGLELQASGVKAFRILVCGKTGVGKSTLINKVFGVEMTEESNDYTQGVHDINTAFESTNHPGLLIHDSRGWQAGSDQELELIAQFLRHRAFQKDPAESLHVIWFCVDSDVSRIEAADKRTFQTIAQFSHNVPVFVVGTKKDKLIAFRKMQLLDEKMKTMDDYKEASRQATQEADAAAEEQFGKLREQLSQLEHYKADGYCCISKDDDSGVRSLLNQTLELIVDERVRLFCVAAQVMDVEQKIDSAVNETMRLGTHAVRTAMVPLPFSGMIGTPTVSRLICEHVMQCFGFPKATPDEVEEIMSRVVLGNLKAFMKVALTQFGVTSAIAVGTAVPTLGIGVIVGAIGCIFAMPPTARMLLKCACDMILILERSFRYQGKYVSVKQIEDAAVYYTTARTKTFSGKEILLQQHVHDEVDRLIPLKKVSISFSFAKLRTGFQEIIYMNRFDKKVSMPRSPATSTLGSNSVTELSTGISAVELDAGPVVPELEGDTNIVAELESPRAELGVSTTMPTRSPSYATDATTQFSAISTTKSTEYPEDKKKAWVVAELDGTEKDKEKKIKSESGSMFKRPFSKWSSRKKSEA